MNTPINLNKARKARERAERQRVADENAVKFGRSKAQKNAEESRLSRERRDIDGHQREE